MNHANVCLTAVLLLTALTPPSCRTDDPGRRPSEKLPKLGELAPRSILQTDPYPSQRRAMPTARFERLTLPLWAPMDAVWQLADTDQLPDSTVDLWHANGMRIGILATNRIGRLREALEPFIGLERGKFMASRYQAPLQTTPLLRRQVRIEVIEQLGLPQPLVLQGGRVQLLVRLTRYKNNTPQLELVPHHHMRKVTLQRRSPLETLLDGRIFSTLKVNIPLEQDRLLMIGLDPPRHTSPPDNQAATPARIDANVSLAPRFEGASAEISGMEGASGGQDHADDNDRAKPRETGTQPTSPLQIEVPYHLGRILLTAVRANRPLQMLLLIGISEPLDSVADDGRVDHPPQRMMKRLRRKVVRH